MDLYCEISLPHEVVRMLDCLLHCGTEIWNLGVSGLRLVRAAVEVPRGGVSLARISMRGVVQGWLSTSLHTAIGVLPGPK